MDDVTLGEMLTAAHRGQVDYCVPGGMSVSQSSSSVMFDGSGQPDGENGRLLSYIHHTCEYKQYCHVGNTTKQCRLGLFQDSDFA